MGHAHAHERRKEKEELGRFAKTSMMYIGEFRFSSLLTPPRTQKQKQKQKHRKVRVLTYRGKEGGPKGQPPDSIKNKNPNNNKQVKQTTAKRAGVRRG